MLRDIFIITFLYETGARAGELSSLGTEIMNKTTKCRQKTYWLTVYGKTDDRDLSFTERTAELWRAWQTVRPPYCSDYAIIGWGNGHPPAQLKPNGISQMIAKRCVQAGVAPFRAHALRRRKINRSRKTVGLEVASLLVDHSNLDTTQTYVDIDENELNSAIIATGLKLDVWI
ncbi:MAG: site-specific integrase [Chloroflexota bacterium]